MSREEFVCCDSPGCGTAQCVERNYDVERWVDVRLVIVVDAEGHCETFEGHACSPECVGPAATAIYAQALG